MKMIPKKLRTWLLAFATVLISAATPLLFGGAVVLTSCTTEEYSVARPNNEEIPSLIAEGEADVMITEITEAPYYVQTDPRLAAPLLNAPFTHGEIGVLMRKGQDDLLELVNSVIRRMKADGSLQRLCEKYGLVQNADK